MAKKAKKAAKKAAAPKKFLVLVSECGGYSQLCHGDFGSNSYATPAAAKAAIDKHMASYGADDTSAVYAIVEVIDVARCNSVTWTGKQVL